MTKMIKNTILQTCVFVVAAFLFLGCDSNDDDVQDDELDIAIPLSIYQKIYKTTSDIYIENGFVYINTDGVPDHKSPYFLDTQWESEKYAPYDGSNPFVTNFNFNPNRISAGNIRFKIPINPKKSSTTTPTSMGPIGVSLNGVPFYNQYAGGGAPLSNEINSFDQYNGHPAPGRNGGGGRYHYHMEPFWLTENYGKDALIGFLLDGFPIYGPEENGAELNSSDLDSHHGHSHPTSDFPSGIYHYHLTSDAPYLNGVGYFGAPGTVSE